jgi:Flp pilus assembly protein TadD
LRWCEGVAIVNQPLMFLRPATIVFVAVLTASAVFADDRSAAKEQVDFGIKVAQNGLWREAQYRWERAVQLDPTYAEAWNNLAIAYEHAGKFDDARKAYETAIKLDPKNMLIRQNYDLFKEINDRTQKRRGAR